MANVPESALEVTLAIWHLLAEAPSEGTGGSGCRLCGLLSDQVVYAALDKDTTAGTNPQRSNCDRPDCLGTDCPNYLTVDARAWAHCAVSRYWFRRYLF